MRLPSVLLLIAFSCPCPAAVVSWGATNRQARIPADMSNIVQIAPPMFLDRNGNVFGAEDQDPRFKWAESAGALTNVAFIATGPAHEATLKADGTVFAWGDTEAACGFVQPDKVAVSISIGRSYMLGLTADREILVQGENQWATTQLPDGLTHAKSVAAATPFAAAVTLDGRVEVWGMDSWYGDIYNIGAIPMDAINVRSIHAGFGHLLALREDETVVAWGLNDHGQCDVPAGLRNVVAVSGGWNHSLALLKNGTVVAWGGSTNLAAIAIPEGLKRVKAIWAGWDVNVALTRELPRLRSDGRSLLLEGETGQSYSVECLDSDEGWRPFLTITNLPEDGFRFEDGAPSTSRFYRALELEP